MDEVETHTTEVLSVDVHPNQNIYMFGGIDDTIFVGNIKTKEKLFTETFTDSIVYCKFMDSNSAFVIVYDGLLIFYECLITEQNVEMKKKKDYKLQDDITAYYYYENQKTIILGTLTGEIHIYESNGNYHNFKADSSQITQIKIHDNSLIISSDKTIIAYDARNFSKIYEIGNIKSEMFFTTIMKNGLLVSCNKELVYYYMSNIQTSFNIESDVLCGIQVMDMLFIGCNGKCSYLVNFTNRINLFDILLKIEDKEVSGINVALQLNGYEIIVGTVCGKIGIGDIRDVGTFNFISFYVGPIHDLVYKNGWLIVGGAAGVDALYVDKF